jgi:hypothetical protein
MVPPRFETMPSLVPAASRSSLCSVVLRLRKLIAAHHEGPPDSHASSPGALREIV